MALVENSITENAGTGWKGGEGGRMVETVGSGEEIYGFFVSVAVREGGWPGEISLSKRRILAFTQVQNFTVPMRTRYMIFMCTTCECTNLAESLASLSLLCYC